MISHISLTETGILPKLIQDYLLQQEKLQPFYQSLLLSEQYSTDEKLLVKAADTLCAYVKTLEELSAGNHEFVLAKKRLEAVLESYALAEVSYFLEIFIPSFSLSLDEISLQDGQL